ncbi:unnamed protein product, partial [Symbiodinium sp. CCMP2456]
MVLIEEVAATPDRAKRDSGSPLVVKTFPANSRSRMSADPSLSVADIYNAFKTYVKECCNDDGAGLLKALTAPTGTSWKSSTPVHWIVKLEPLLSELLAKVPSGVLTSRKSKEAFRRLHDDYPMLKNVKKHDHEQQLLVSDTVDTLDDSLRMVLAHIRDLKLSKTSLERVAKKAKTEELRVIHKLLDQIALTSAENRIRQNSFGSETSASSKRGMMGGQTAPSRTSPKKAKIDDAMIGGLASSSDNRVDPAEVFSRVLQRKNAFLAAEDERPAASFGDDDEPLLQKVLLNAVEHSENEEGDDYMEGQEEEDVEEEAPSHDDGDDDDDRALANEAKTSAPANCSGYTLRKKLNTARKKLKNKSEKNDKKKTPPAATAFQLRRIREQQKKKAGKKADDDE